MVAIYTAQWPVEDDQAHMSQLKVEALSDLITLTARDGCLMNGEPEWETYEAAGHLFLQVRVPVLLLPDDDTGEDDLA